jgi:hypothetical protein
VSCVNVTFFSSCPTFTLVGPTDRYSRIYYTLSASWSQWSGRLLGIISWDPSVCKSNRLHVDILRFIYINIEVCSINSSKVIGNSPEVLNFNQLFLKLNRFIYNCRFSLTIAWSTFRPNLEVLGAGLSGHRSQTDFWTTVMWGHVGSDNVVVSVILARVHQDTNPASSKIQWMLWVTEECHVWTWTGRTSVAECTSSRVSACCFLGLSPRGVHWRKS